jgi:hypothetical protein
MVFSLDLARADFLEIFFKIDRNAEIATGWHSGWRNPQYTNRGAGDTDVQPTHQQDQRTTLIKQPGYEPELPASPGFRNLIKKTVYLFDIYVISLILELSEDR